MVDGNRRADQLVSALALTTHLPNIIGQARLSHEFFHRSARTLKWQFQLSLARARTTLVACPDCARLPNTQASATNPRGLNPLQLWQTDVTEYSSCGRLKYLQVSIDTFSGLFWATAR
ncbi:POK19 protein, partial [Todus mexicanus]|nr:POK19 protein [Todus mexicanus]